MYEQATSHAREIDVPGLFQALFMHMTDGIALHQVVCDGAGRPTNYRVVEVNAQYERVAGRRREQLIGKLADEAYQEREPPHLGIYGKVALEGQPARFEEYHRQPGGQRT
jgi:PAS domain-containing protein